MYNFKPKTSKNKEKVKKCQTSKAPNRTIPNVKPSKLGTYNSVIRNFTVFDSIIQECRITNWKNEKFNILELKHLS